MAATRQFLVLVSFLTLIVTVVTPASLAEKGPDGEPPSAPTELTLVSATPTQLVIDWSRSKERVAGYEVKVGDTKLEVEDTLTGTTHRSRYTIERLACGTAYSIAVAAFDRAGRRSAPALATMATSACVEVKAPAAPTTSQPPSGDKHGAPSGDKQAAPSGDKQAAPSGDKQAAPSGDKQAAPSGDKQAAPSGDKQAAPSGDKQTSTSSGSTGQRATDTEPPAAPTDLALVSASATQLKLDWSRSGDRVAGYDVKLADTLAGTTNRTRYTIGSLTCGTSYPVSVLAFDRAGNRSAPALATVSTSACVDVTPPTAPTRFRQEFTTASSAVLAWDASSDNVGVVSYGVYDAGVRIASTSEPRQAFSSLACGKTYSYYIDAADAAGNRSSKAAATVSTAACGDVQPPTVPAPVSVVDASDSAVSVAWPAASDNVGVKHYNVYRGNAVVTQTPATTSTVGGLECGTSYSIGVTAEDGSGNVSGAASTVAQTDPCAGSTDTQPPTTPTGLAATSATQTSIGLAWSPSTDNVGVTGYTVYRGGTAAGSSTTASYTLNGLACGTSYLVAVEATDGGGNRSGRAEAYFSTAACSDTTPPTAPASVALATRTQTSISVTWPAATDNTGVVGYGVYRGGKLAEVAERAYTFTGLSCGTNYTLGVDAYDAAGNRSGVTSVLIATNACSDTTPPTVPTNLAASAVTQTGLTLSWSASTDNVGVARYEVTRNGTQLTSVTTTSSNQTGLTCGTSYAFAVLAVDAAGNKSAQAQLNASAGTCSTGPTPTLQQVDGGVGYYGGFSNPLSTSTIPIGVWFESVISQSDIDLDKDVGLNLYVVLTRNSSLGLIGSNGMKAMVQQSEWRDASLGGETAAWELHDEIDMQMSPAAGCAELKSLRDSLPADGRLRYNNFGKGVMFWESNAEAACYVNAVTLPSNDIYWFTDPNVCGWSEGGTLLKGGQALTDAECRRASNYGATVQRMRSLVSPSGSKPIWNFVEVGHPFSEDWAPTITGPQIRAAVWHSFIAGARGIIYFNHNFGGSCHSQHVLRDGCGASVRPAVKAVNAQVQSLAGALNAPTLNSGFSASSSVKAMAKWNGQNFYVFAGSSENANSTGSFSIPCVGNATATVLGENRTLSVSAGSFSDSFSDGNAVHIYRIDGGSTCGLS